MRHRGRVRKVGRRAVGVGGRVPKSGTFSEVSSDGTTATGTTAAAHGLATGDRVTIAEQINTDLNGTFTITVTGASSFTWVAATASPGSWLAVGTWATA